MGDTTTHGLPYPVGTDRVMDGDNAMQALAEKVDAALWADTAPADALAPGLWQTAVGSVVCSASSLAAAPGTTIVRARWMKIGHTVWFQGDAAIGATAVADVAVSLPAAAGVPQARILDPGTCVLVDNGGGPGVQTGQCVMSTGKDRIIPISPSGAYVDATTTSALRWSIVYETLT